MGSRAGSNSQPRFNNDVDPRGANPGPFGPGGSFSGFGVTSRFVFFSRGPLSILLCLRSIRFRLRYFFCNWSRKRKAQLAPGQFDNGLGTPYRTAPSPRPPSLPGPRELQSVARRYIMVAILAWRSGREPHYRYGKKPDFFATDSVRRPSSTANAQTPGKYLRLGRSCG